MRPIVVTTLVAYSASRPRVRVQSRIVAVVARAEREAIRAALKLRCRLPKARGVKFGNPARGAKLKPDPKWQDLLGKETSGINRAYFERRIAYTLQ